MLDATMQRFQSIPSAGYFGLMKYLFDQPADLLEVKAGYAPGLLGAGWKLLYPRTPIQAYNIDLRGSTRWSAGILRDGEVIGAVIAARADIAAARKKIATFFDRGLDRQPAKILPINEPAGYPSAPTGMGIPQFKLFDSIQWVILLQVPPGGVLKRAEVERALSHFRSA